MSRTAKVTAVLACSVVVCLAAFEKSPYLQNPADSSIVVRWQTVTAESGRVDYGLSNGYGRSVCHSDPTVDHELTLTGLLPDTAYHYRVVSGPDSSPDAIFLSSRTPARPFRFIAYGDNHSNDSGAHQRVVDRMMLVERPALAVNIGDMTSNGRTPQYGLLLSIERALLSRTPLMPAVGNHDAESLPNWYRYFALPGNERWYSLRTGNAASHSLNVNESFVPGSDQYDWFLNELLADSADPDVRHIFVYFHLPPYTTSTVYSGDADVQQYLCPLFERFGVRIVFSGHVHAYEHSLVNGVHYIITGGGGGTLATSWNSPQPWTVYREATYEFVLVDVAGDTIRTVGVRPDGSELDALVIAPTGVRAGAPAPAPPVTLRALPNPSESEFTLRLHMAEAGPAGLTVCDAAGRLVCSFPERRLEAGLHTFTWDASTEPAGLYYCIVRTKHGASTVALVRTASGRSEQH